MDLAAPRAASVQGRIQRAIEARGSVNLMLTGDSTGIGTSSQGGVFLGMVGTLTALNVPFRTVGPLTASAEPFTTAFALQNKHRAEGGRTTAELAVGGAGSIANPIDTDVHAHDPDWLVVMSGFNDRGQSGATVLGRFRDLLNRAFQAKPSLAVTVVGIWHDYSAGAYYFDAGQRAVIDAQIAAVAEQTALGRSCEFVDTIGPMGQQARGLFSTSATVPAIYHIDNPHLYVAGYGFVAAHVAAKGLGLPVEDVLATLRRRSIWKDEPFSVRAQTATGSSTDVAIKAAENGRRLVLTGYELRQNATADTTGPKLREGSTDLIGNMPTSANESRVVPLPTPRPIAYNTALNIAGGAVIGAQTTVVAHGHSSIL